jgi:hypothetical protein
LRPGLPERLNRGTNSLRKGSEMKALFLWIILIFCSIPAVSQAITPMDSYNSLVAGDDDPGYRDGAFDEARFHEPSGLAFDEDGKRLFVADQKNDRVRVIYMDENDRVETLVGPSRIGGRGRLNGPVLHQPQSVAYVSGDRLAIYDLGDGTLKLADFGRKNIRTLATGLQNLWDLVYRSEDDALYFTDPTLGKLQRYDLKKAQLTEVSLDRRLLGKPKALCVYQGRLFVSESSTSLIYRVDIKTDGLSAKLTYAGKGISIRELTSTNGCIYALQNDRTPLAVVVPQYRPVSLASAGGLLLSNSNHGYSPLIKTFLSSRTGFTASPRERGRIFISQPSLQTHSVISVKDYHFGELWLARSTSLFEKELSDFEYPEEKPHGTFRILVVGSSMVVTAPKIIEDEAENKIRNMVDYDFHSLRVNTFTKQLELRLNTQASLIGSDEHFEVLEMGRPGQKIQFFINDEVPAVVQKYHIDLVLGLVTPLSSEQCEDYFNKPLNRDGIPTGQFDPEYLLKPWKERVPRGAPERLLKACMAKGLVDESPKTQVQFGSFESLLASGDRDIREALIEMLGKPFSVFDRKMKAERKPVEKTPMFGIFFVPGKETQYVQPTEDFWSEVCVYYHLDLLDLTKPFEDLKYSYYPTNEACCGRHYTTNGNDLIAILLTHYLPQKGWIPMPTPVNAGKAVR